MKQTTWLFDAKGQEIFVGDKIVKWAQMSSSKEGIENYHQIYEVQKHQEGNIVTFLLGNAHKNDNDTYVPIWNSWEGEEVIVISDEMFKDKGLEFGQVYFIDDNNNFIIPKQHRLMGVSEEEYKELLAKLKQAEINTWFGK